MNKTSTFSFKTLIIGCLLLLFSCGKADFINEMQGKWKVNEVNYITNTDTIFDYPANMSFIFTGGNYQTLVYGVVQETGSYNVNGKVTQITFTSNLGHNIMLIEEQTATYQHWRSKTKIEDFYLGFKLDKIE